MSKKNLTASENRFLDDIASLLMPWGMPQATARLYGYLLLSNAAVTLDQIAEDLEISKSSASVAARLLEKYSLARRFGERGSKRVFYEAADTYGGVMLEQCSILGAIASLLQSRVPSVSSKVTKKRLESAATFYSSMRDAIEGAVEKTVGAIDKKN